MAAVSDRRIPMPTKPIRNAALLTVLLGWNCLAGAQTTAPSYAPPPKPVTPGDHAVSRAIGFLLKQIGADGRCAGEYPAGNPRHGGVTALCVYALLNARVDYRTPEVKRAIQWLSKARPTGTYAVSMRACAMSACKDKRVEGLLKQDIAWLVKAAGKNGAYSYTSAGGGELAEYDNSNGHLAALGVWAGVSRLELRNEALSRYWRKVRRHWLDQQQLDGGWGYRIRPGAMQTRTYGSMTAAGLATLLVCFDTLRREDFVRCTVWAEDKPIAKALAWMTKNYNIRANPGKGIQWRYYWLFALERVALADGRKFIGKNDWFADGTRELLGDQNSNGSWGFGEGGQLVPQTAFGMLFLARGRRPVLLNKLQYKGKWNCRPHDAANLARHVSFNFEQQVTWQIVGPESGVADLHDAPILYISGAGPCRIPDTQIDKIRTFVHQGGTIVSEAAGNSGAFTLDVQGLYKRLFPDYALERLDDKHKVYSLYYSPKDITGLSGVSNGARLLAIHSPRELSLALQLGVGRKANMPAFEMMTNVYLLNTDMGHLPRRGMRRRPQAKPFKPRAVLNVARLKYKGNYDPEPLAWKHLAVRMGNDHRIKLQATAPMDITKLDATKWPVAAMTGTGNFTLSDEEQAALKRYFKAGGRLIADACGGDERFARAIEQVIAPLVEGGRRGRLANHVSLNGPAKITRVYYRRSLATLLRDEKSVPQISGVFRDAKPVVIYSPFDLTVGLTGYEGYTLKGYKPQSAIAVMTNLLCDAAGIKLTPAPAGTTRPAGRS